MAQLVLQVSGFLLALLFSLIAAQNSSSVPPTAAPGGSFTFDCRRGDGDASCANNSSCDLNTGTCSCTGIASPNYKCDSMVPDGSSCSPPCSNGFCQSGTCTCDQSHYGPDCSLERVQVICNKNNMLVNINPMENFAGSIYAQNVPTCKLVLDSPDLSTSTFKDQITNNTTGWSLTYQSNSTNCSNAITVNPDGSMTAKIYIQYNKLFKSSVDQVVTAKCSSNDNTTISSNITNIGDSDNGVNQVTSDGKVDSVTVFVRGKSLGPLPDPVFLGDEIHLYYMMIVNSSSVHKDFQLLQCWANDGLFATDYRELTFLTAGCPEPKAKSLFAGLPAKTITKRGVNIDVALKAFMFIGSSNVVFVCSIVFCIDVNSGACKQDSCPGYSSSAAALPPLDSGQLNNTSGTPTSLVRRKRDATPPLIQEVSAALKIRDPNDNIPSEPVKEQPAAFNVCTNDADIIAVIAILGVCVFMLLITTIMLIICTRKSKKKPDPGHSERYSRTVETMRYPRLEMNTTHNASC